MCVNQWVNPLSAIRKILIFSLVCISLQCLSGSRVHAADTLPDETVRDGISKLAAAARPQSNHGESSEADLANAVRDFLAEYTDVRYAARLILASHWENTAPGQRDRFVAVFNNHVTNLLVRLVPGVDFGSVTVDPFSGDIEETPLMIQATFHTSDEKAVQFILVIHVRDGRWLVFDVIAAGISYVRVFRSQFYGEITDTGFEAMIERFEIRNSGQGSD